MRQEDDGWALDKVDALSREIADDVCLDIGGRHTGWQIGLEDQVDGFVRLEGGEIGLKQELPRTEVVPIKDGQEVVLMQTIQWQGLNVPVRAEDFRVNCGGQQSDAAGRDAGVREHLPVVMTGDPNLIEVLAFLLPVLGQAIRRPVQFGHVPARGRVQLVDL